MRQNQVLFGDGWHGRRLPSGVNNVRVVHRQGHGLDGNLPAGSLGILVRPVPILDKALQSLLATGGKGLEPVSSLRENAPAIFTHTRSSRLAQLAGACRVIWAPACVPPWRPTPCRVCA